MRSLPTWRSPIAENELWRRARQQLDQYGDDAMLVAVLQMDKLRKADDRAGYATWAAILLRIAKLGPGGSDGAVIH